MGMSASQARLLSLQARQSNLEYQGQQINQERSILSQQCTALYNSLLAMTVPTPPSTSDFTKVQYTATQGATSWTFDTASMKPGKGGTHIVTLGRSDVGNTLSKAPTTAVVQRGEQEIKGTMYTADTYKTPGKTETKPIEDTYANAGQGKVEGYMKCVDEFDSSDEGRMYVMTKSGQFVKYDESMEDYETNKDKYEFIYNQESFDGEMNTDSEKNSLRLAKYVLVDKKDPDDIDGDYVAVAHATEEVETEKGDKKIITTTELNDFYVYDGTNDSVRPATAGDMIPNADGTMTLKPGLTYLKRGNGNDVGKIPDGSNPRVAGFETYTLEQAKADGRLGEGTTAETAYKAYQEAIENAALSYGGRQLTEDDFLVYFDGDGNIHFVMKEDADSPDNKAEVFNFEMNGKYTKKEEKEGCIVTFDGGTGRITSIQVPAGWDEAGNVTSYTTMEVTAETVTDENAYRDAYNQYEFAQHEYDKMNQDINRKTEIIQQEDRNLELKLQRLDNERTQIKTEIDAVEKVINENIEKSYKTFSG